MRSNVTALCTLLACITLTGCVYTHVRVPMSTEFRNTRAVTKSGESKLRSVAWLVAWGDAGLQRAATNGQLNTLEYADHDFLNILFGLYISGTTIVYGN